jgi:hypothetical protein
MAPAASQGSPLCGWRGKSSAASVSWSFCQMHCLRALRHSIQREVCSNLDDRRRRGFHGGPIQ